MIRFHCDECDKTPAQLYSLMTGYVYIDDKFYNQYCHLCDEHYPKRGKSQPNNCKRVRFHWPKGEECQK